MTASMSKRQQARNERDLQDLISSVPGNDRCADCQARNPGWASWSLGIFLCMRCAALHRKLGTHISKVKSLSMDTWSTDQVENMRKNGNISVNKIYNPKNVKPGIPLDVDEVDSAMERFIRQKYQERSLADGKPRPPSRDEVNSPPPRSPQPSPAIHIQPAKKGKIFGFKLRASSSAYPVSKRDTRNLPPLEPTIENAFRTEVHSNKPSKPRVSDVSEKDKLHEEKLATLREMGFPDDKRNSAVLNRLSGDMSRTVESLVRLGEGADSRKPTPVESKTSTPSRATFPDDVTSPARHDSGGSNNPFNRPTRSQILTVPQPQGHQTVSYNPLDVPTGPQSAFQPMDQAFQAMQVSQPLFPHSTGGYPSREPPMPDPRFQHSMTPPVSNVSQQYGYTTSPTAMNNSNPFFQSTQSQNSNVFDSYAPTQQNAPSSQPTQQNAPFSAPPTNPFFNQQPSYQPIQSPLQTAPLQTRISASNPFGVIQPALQSASLQSQNSFSNPFGIPPSPQSATTYQQNNSSFDNQSAFFSSNGPPHAPYQQQNPQSQVQSPSQNSIASPQDPQHRVQSFQTSIPTSQPQTTYQQPSYPYQSPSQQQLSPQYQAQPSPMAPQPTGRFDKNSILALYNYPHLAPQPMPTIPDDVIPSTKTPSSNTSSSNLQPSHPDSVPNNARRSATMPVSSTYLSTPGSRNPFSSTSDNSNGSSNVTSPTSAHPSRPSIMHHHASQESVSIANLESGRHSPDAFANLSARFVKE